MRRKNRKSSRITGRTYLIILKATLFVLLLAAVIGIGAKIPPYIQSIVLADDVNADNTVDVTIQIDGSQFTGDDYWCYVGSESNPGRLSDDDWIFAENGECVVSLQAGQFYIFARDEFGQISLPSQDSLVINKVFSLNIDVEEVFLALTDTRQLYTTLLTIGDVDTTIHWSSSDSGVCKVDENGLVTAISPGVVIITASTSDGTSAQCEVVSTDLIIPMGSEESSTMPRVPSRYYTLEQSQLLDRILFSRVAEAGVGSRAGVVAAARFLTMEFPFRIPYFYEHGRLNNFGMKMYCDGEGRFYHKGLYLHESKYDELDPKGIIDGPAMWGEPLCNWVDNGGFVSGVLYPNGLDCSGFVTWACYNGGWDVSDTGAGDYAERDDDMCDYGIRVWITRELMKSGKVKVGDLIGKDGHIALIVGMDETDIYIAESLHGGVIITRLKIEDRLLWSPVYDYIMLMDTYCNGYQGNYEEMW